ncbi:hypothetical protein GCM10010300_24450 [Streptomyces olivaceoviridis]|nr:hypothetical protein GCM10010300_24450 [Streptomyces olivaceoviridis]
MTAQTGRTTVFVTHSADEAVFLGSRIVVLTKGPGTVALDLPIPLPRGDADAEELRNPAAARLPSMTFTHTSGAELSLDSWWRAF